MSAMPPEMVSCDTRPSTSAPVNSKMMAICARAERERRRSAALARSGAAVELSWCGGKLQRRARARKRPPLRTTTAHFSVSVLAPTDVPLRGGRRRARQLAAATAATGRAQRPSAKPACTHKALATSLLPVPGAQRKQRGRAVSASWGERRCHREQFKNNPGRRRSARARAAAWSAFARTHRSRRGTRQRSQSACRQAARQAWIWRGIRRPPHCHQARPARCLMAQCRAGPGPRSTFRWCGRGGARPSGAAARRSSAACCAAVRAAAHCARTTRIHWYSPSARFWLEPMVPAARALEERNVSGGPLPFQAPGMCG